MCIILFNMNSVKEINVKNRTFYFFDDVINVKNLDPNIIRIDGKSYKNILIYHTGYVTVNNLSYTIVNCVNHLYLVINKIN